MTIKVGDRIPEATLFVTTPDGRKTVTTSEVFAGRKAVLFAVPGAFTGTCHKLHVPSYLHNLDAIKAKGVDIVACLAVNDADVMRAWSKQTDADGRIMFLADGNGEFTRKVGLERDLSSAGMGKRSARYSMILNDCVVKTLNVEEKPGVNVSGGDTILDQL
ncbi:MAG TPA: peroxiredoxin [Aestuariivirgaceae bacterium]|jgi:peroxiredoxin